MTAGTVDRALSLRGAARAVLECRGNFGIGSLRDSPRLLIAAASYLT